MAILYEHNSGGQTCQECFKLVERERRLTERLESDTGEQMTMHYPAPAIIPRAKIQLSDMVCDYEKGAGSNTWVARCDILRVFEGKSGQPTLFIHLEAEEGGGHELRAENIVAQPHGCITDGYIGYRTGMQSMFDRQRV